MYNIRVPSSFIYWWAWELSGPNVNISKYSRAPIIPTSKIWTVDNPDSSQAEINRLNKTKDAWRNRH